jgi:hypothetical protein
MELVAWSSGIANDGSTVVICFHRLRLLGMTKPGDDHWTLVKYQGGGMIGSPLMFAGRFYCVNYLKGVMVLETGPDQTPRLEVAAKLNIRICLTVHTVHLVNNFGDLMLVHRRGGYTKAFKWFWWYDLYKVDLDTGTLISVKTLGGTGGAVFMGMYCALSVSLEDFPSASIYADTIYLSSDYSEITNGDLQRLPCVLLHTSKPLISIARKYSIIATLNILSLYILVHHIMLHTSITKKKI